MTLNGCRDYSDKAGALSSNLQLVFDAYLAYGSEDSSSNDKLSIPIFPIIYSTTCNTHTLTTGKQEEESASSGQRKQGVET